MDNETVNLIRGDVLLAYEDVLSKNDADSVRKAEIINLATEIALRAIEHYHSRVHEK